MINEKANDVSQLVGLVGCMLIHILKVLGVFTITLVISSALSIPFMKRKLLSGTITQIALLLISLLLGVFVLGLDIAAIGIKACDIIPVVFAFVLSLCLGFPLAYLSMVCSRDFEHPLEIKSLPIYVFMGLILSPTAEEIMFRGVLEGYLLATTNMWIAIILPALLFSLMHIAPFSKAPKRLLAIILISALLLGIVAGAFRYITSSIIPAIVSHASFNLIGKILEVTVKRKE